MGTIIQPTIGRVVLCRPNGDHRLEHLCCIEGEALAGTVAYVNPDNGRVNLSLADHLGQHLAIQGVVMVQEGETFPEPGVAYCHWMPYQLGQAAKTEQVIAESTSKKKS